ncbi:hypothetical protein [Mycoplasma procyoni]|uniref:hypothetical protein n=1 Tax=Mycoplasma procyoni TaxID=568784 RepID=UPI00197C2F92|nr:hypothetical protein [Mycoplasma procyoni]MBN3534587.1 hypothetical protein [Mycoplasma procyoni]
MQLSQSKTLIKNAFSQNKTFHSWILESENAFVFEQHITFLVSQIRKKEYKSFLEIKNSTLFIDSNSLNKEAVDHFLNKLSFRSQNESESKILIIENLEKASNIILNTLLKTIEEPTENTFIIFSTFNSNNILKTIKSRCILVKCVSETNEQNLAFIQQNPVFLEFKDTLEHLYLQSQETLEKNLDLIQNLILEFKNLTKKFDYKAFLKILYKNINAKNFDLICELFISLFKQSFNHHTQIKNIDKSQIIEIINLLVDFSINISRYNLNFDLQKNALLTKITEVFNGRK